MLTYSNGAPYVLRKIQSALLELKEQRFFVSAKVLVRGRLILPDISSTDEDLSGRASDVNPDTTKSNENNNDGSDNNDDDSVTRNSQSLTPDAGEQSEGEKDKMDAGDICEGYGEDNDGEGPIVIPFP
ncbi:MAG: hypothetical protein GEU26_07530 [Nitrososphaeraceae archaeon]|nr:hypothetical protein [Nitrososphaeraceae archaeon]